MSSLINISKLPTADEVVNGDFFVIDNGVVTKKIDFSNVIFGLDNVTFASTISAQSTEINTLSSNLTTLSAQEASDVSNLYSFITTAVQSATASLTNILYPINSIKFTLNNINPSTTILGTTWTQVAQGLFLAGVGAPLIKDKNGDSITVDPGYDSANQLIGEYNHKLTPAELANHQHPTNGAGNVGGSANGNVGGGGILGANQVGLTQPGPSIAVSSGGTVPGFQAIGDNPHNNVPPFYGVYVWQRTA